MGQDTKIEWCSHTFNPWRGCTKISPGCAHCYAEALSKRNPKVLGIWGDNGTRVVASESAWKEPLKWDRQARQAGERHRVFCASLADVFENREELVNPRIRLFHLMHMTPSLDWLLLTKRPEFAREWLEGSAIQGLWPCDNVWLGTSVENQDQADKRIPILLQTPAKVRFLSVEPLLGPVDLDFPQNNCDQPSPESECPDCGGDVACEGEGWRCVEHSGMHIGCGWKSDGWNDEPDARPSIDWVIIGGESGPHARPCDLAWIRSIVRQCRAAGVPVFVKQMGSNLAGYWLDPDGPGDGICYHSEKWKLRDPHGADPAEWPADLRVREMPAVTAQEPQPCRKARKSGHAFIAAKGLLLAMRPLCTSEAISLAFRSVGWMRKSTAKWKMKLSHGAMNAHLYKKRS